MNYPGYKFWTVSIVEETFEISDLYITWPDLPEFHEINHFEDHFFYKMFSLVS